MKPSTRISTALSILACAALCAIPGSLAAAAPAATQARAHSHVHRARHRCASRSRHARRCKTLGRRSRLTRARRALPAPTHTTAPHSAAVTLAQQRATALTAALDAPCANTQLTPAEGDIPLVRAAVLCLVNRERAQNGVAPLTANPRLEAAAESHCAELLAVNYFAHVSPSGETPVDRIRTTGYIPGPSVGYIIGENLAWGTYSLATPQSIVSAWIASPGHLANILEAKYTETGIGVTAAVPGIVGAGSPGATYAQEFGVIIH